MANKRMSVELAGWMLMTQPKLSHQQSICFRLIGSEHLCSTQPRLTPSVTADAVYISLFTGGAIHVDCPETRCKPTFSITNI